MIASEPTRVRAGDGCELAVTVFRPPATTQVEQVVLVCSTMGAKRDTYFAFAEFLAEQGRAVATFDYRGIGNSRPSSLRGFVAGLSDWGRVDLASLIGWAGETFPERRLSVVAHGIGAQIFGLASNNSAVSDLLAVGARCGYRGRGSRLLRLRALIPVASLVFGYFPARLVGLGEDLPSGVAREWARWGRADDAQRPGYGGYRGRLRVLSASDDENAPMSQAQALSALYPAAEPEHRRITPAEMGVQSIGHFGYFRESVGRRLWPEEASWLSAPSV